jgi:4-hydroxybenzoate polyprenyltransferase
MTAAKSRVSARDIGQIILSSRPISWINTAFPFAAAYLLSTREIDATLIIGTLYFLIPYNLAMYGINDVFDYASDLANPRKGGIEGALLSPRIHRGTLWAAALTNLPFLVYLLAVGSPVSWLCLGVSVFAVVAYSAPGLRFKEKPFLDSITSSLHFVTPAIVGLALANASLTPTIIVVLVAFFFWGMAAHASALLGPRLHPRRPDPRLARGRRARRTIVRQSRRGLLERPDHLPA